MDAERANRARRAGSPERSGAFTLVELLVSMTLLIVIVVIVIRITDQTSSIWRSSSSKIQAFQEARAGFESMTRKLGQATLNTYYDYYDASNTPRRNLAGSALAGFVPVTYDRISDLHFVSGQAETLLRNSAAPIVTQTHAVFFQAPLGYSAAYPKLDDALNACGYFLMFDDAGASIPDHVKATPGYQPRWRFRLMEMTQRTEHLAVFDPLAAGDPSQQNDWFLADAATSSRVVSENVIALVLLPKLPRHEDAPGTTLAPNFNYNSRIPLGATSDAAWPGANPPFPSDAAGDSSRHHQLPPALRVVMIVLDETSAARVQGSASTPASAIDLSATNLFTDAAALEADVQAVEDICNAKAGNLTGNTVRLTYRVFNTEIVMREAKWSRN